MVTVENVIKVLDHENYNGMSLLKEAIEAGEIETGPYNGAFSTYNYAITKDSFHNYLYHLGLSERKIDIIFDNI